MSLYCRDIGEGNTIWIGGIDPDAREKDLDKLFGEYGNITRISIKYVRSSIY